MYGQMTAGSWIYIGTQGILQGTYETFAAAGRRTFGTDGLAGRLVVTAGLGGMGGAQPLAATMCGGTFLGARSTRRGSTAPRERYLDWLVAVARRGAGRRARSRRGTAGARSIGVRRQRRRRLPERLPARHRAGSAHRPDHRARPAQRLRPRRPPARGRRRPASRPTPSEYQQRSIAIMARHVEAMLELQRPRLGHVFDYGNNLRAQAQEGGRPRTRSRIPASCRATSGPLFCEGQGPFRWVALSGDPRTSPPPTARCSSRSRRRRTCAAGSRSRRERVAFQGLPARICWLGYGERAKAGLPSTSWSRAAR